MDPDNYCRCRYPDDYDRCRNGVIFPMFPIFPMLPIFLVTAIFSDAPSTRKNAAGSREQGDNAYQQKDGFHIYCCFVISYEDSSSVVINSL